MRRACSSRKKPASSACPATTTRWPTIELVESLGEPLRDGYLPAGSMHSNGQSQFVIAIADPQGKGRVFLNAKRSGDHWDYPMLYVVTDGKDAIDLAALDDIEAADSCALEECRAKGECPPSLSL
ncbi:MAG: cytochrome c oxidase assembly factor Coa1 family protein [Stenotrophomonas maltophilia]